MPTTFAEHSAHEDDLDEAVSAFLEGDDDEDIDDEALPFPLPLPFSLGGGRRSRAPFVPPGALNPSRPGVQSGRIETPRGSATFRLPEPLVTESAFKEAIGKLEQSINGVSSQLTAQITGNQKQVEKQIRGLTRQQTALAKATKSSLARMKKAQQSQATTSMLMTVLLTQDAQRRLEEHKHLSTGEVDKDSLPADNSSFLLFLPMFMQQEGGGGDNNMMMMFLLLPLLQGQGK